MHILVLNLHYLGLYNCKMLYNFSARFESKLYVSENHKWPHIVWTHSYIIFYRVETIRCESNPVSCKRDLSCVGRNGCQSALWILVKMILAFQTGRNNMKTVIEQQVSPVFINLTLFSNASQRKWFSYDFWMKYFSFWNKIFCLDPRLCRN